MWWLIDNIMVTDCNASDIIMFSSCFSGTPSCVCVSDFYCFGIPFHKLSPNSEVSYTMYLVN